MKTIIRIITAGLICLLFIPAQSLSGLEPERAEAYTSINFYLNLYDFDKAETLIHTFLKKYPQDPFILTEWAHILQNVKNEKEKAAEILETVLTLAPDYGPANTLYASMIYLDYISDKSMNKQPEPNRLKKALSHLETAIRDDFPNYETFFLHGAVLSELNLYEKALESLEKASRLKLSAEPYYYMIEIQQKMRNTDKEMALHRRLLDLNPYNAGSLKALSQHHLSRNELKQAGAYLERLYQKYPEDSRITTEYLYSLFASREVERFLEVSENADIASTPVLIFARAYFLSMKDRLDEAITLLVKLEKPDLRAKLLLADLYKRKNDYYKAYEILNPFPDQDKNYLFYSLQLDVLSILDMNKRTLAIFKEIKDNADLLREFTLRDYYNILFACSALDDIPSMTTVADLIKKYDPKTPMPQIEELNAVLAAFSDKKPTPPSKLNFELNGYLIINIYKQRGLYDEAAALLTDWMNRDSRQLQLRLMELGDIYIRQNNSGQLEEIIRKMQLQFPDSHEIKNFRAYCLALENRELETALLLSRDTLSVDAESPAYLDTHGYILLKMGRSEESRPFLEKAYRKNPFEKEIIEHLADYYRQTNQWDKVSEIYLYAINNGVDFQDQLQLKLKEMTETQKISAQGKE